MILYELFVGQPPFYTTSIYSLIHQIVQDSVKYPPEMSREFRHFLKVRGHRQPHFSSAMKLLFQGSIDTPEAACMHVQGR